jgi:nitrogen fixation protein FixH
MSVETERHFTGRHMLIIMVSFFAVVFSANMTMVYFARHSWTGLVVRNSYVASQEFNAKTTLMNKAADISVQIEVDKTLLKLVLRDKAGQTVDASSLVLTLGRPSHEGEDQTIRFVARSAGIFTAQHTLAHGQWSGSVKANIPGKTNWARPVYLLVRD